MKFLKWKGLSALALAGMIALTGCGGGGGSEQPAGDGSDTTTEQSGEKNLAESVIDHREAKDQSLNPAEATGRKDTIIVGLTEFNGVFNPILYSTNYDFNVVQMVFGEGITDNDATGKMIDGAGSFTVSEDGLVYTATIKDGVNFSDGKPVTADDYIFTYEVMADPAYDGQSDIGKQGIVGVKEYKEGADSISGIKKIDDKTFEITLENANAAFWQFLSGAPMPKHYYGEGYKKGDMSTIHALDSKPMGAGPYKLTEYQEGQFVKFVANEGYWRGAPKTPNVIFTVTTDENAMQMITTGAVDVQELTVSEEYVEAIEDAGFLNLDIFPTNGYGYMGFNVKSNPMLADLKVRQALAHATNRADIVQNVFGPYAKVINIPQSRISWAFTDEGVNPYEYDLEKAAKLLEEAGWAKNADGMLEKDGKVLTINFVGMPAHSVVDVIVPAIAKDWKDLGIDLKIEYLDFPTLSDKVKKDAVDMWFMAWSLTADPDDATETYSTDKGNNNYAYSNPKVDELFIKGRQETNQDKRKEIYAELYRELNRDLPEILVYQRSDMWAINSRIKGLEPSPFRHFSTSMWQAEIVEQ